MDGVLGLRPRNKRGCGCKGWLLGLAACLAVGVLLVWLGWPEAVRAGNGWSYYGQLSAEQQRLLQGIYADYAGRLYALKAEIAAKRSELEARLAAPEIEAEAIETVVAELNSLKSELFAEQVGMIIEMRRNGLPYFGMHMGPRPGFPE